MPEVDHFLGTNAYVRIGDFSAAEARPYSHPRSDPHPRRRQGQRRRSGLAYLKISEAATTPAPSIIPTVARMPMEDMTEAQALASRGSGAEPRPRTSPPTGTTCPASAAPRPVAKALCAVDCGGSPPLRLRGVSPTRSRSSPAGERWRYLDMPLRPPPTGCCARYRRGGTLPDLAAGQAPGADSRPHLPTSRSPACRGRGDFSCSRVRHQRFERMGCFSTRRGAPRLRDGRRVPPKMSKRRWRGDGHPAADHREQKSTIGKRIRCWLRAPSPSSTSGQPPQARRRTSTASSPSARMGYPGSSSPSR